MNSLVISSRAKIRITAITRLKHTALYEAAKSLGSAKALADRLGVDQGDVGEWINLKGCPPAQPTKKWPIDRLAKLESDLLAITGKTVEDLFPESLRNNVDFLRAPKKFEQEKEVEEEALLHYAAATTGRIQATPMDEAGSEELRKSVAEVLESLSYREKEIIKLRWGLGGDATRYTLDEVAHIFKVGRERIRQIESKAIRKLQQPSRAAKLVAHLPDHAVAPYREPVERWPSEIYAESSK